MVMRKFSSVRFVLAALTVCFLFCGFSLSAAETGEFSYYTDEEGAHVTAFNGSDAHIVIPDELGGKPVVSVSLNDCADRLGVARITLSENVVRLDDHAFYGFQHLQIVDGLDQIQYVGEQAFAFCSLTDLVFSDELKHIGARAFEYGALTNLTIPDDITYDTATFTCWTLTKITLTDGSGEKKLSMKDEVLFNADYTYLAAYPVKNPRCAYKIPDSVTYVDWTAFHCAGNPLCELEVPASVIGGAPTDIDILGKLVMRVYEGTAGHAMAKHLSGVYDKNGFEYVLLDSGDPGEALSDFVARIVAQTTDGSMTEYQKALRLHDWLTAHAQYDQTFTHMTAHDLFTYGLGICCSYSDAYSWLLSEAGIQSKVVGNYDHALVAARLDGRWTYIDPTHNDDKVDKPYFGMNDVMFKHRYGALYPDHFNNMIVVTEKLNTSSVKSHYWYREGWHKDALYYLENEIKTHIMRGETSFIVKTTDIPIYVEPMMVMLCAGLVDEDGIKVNDTAYDLVCSIYESGDWYVFVNDGLENDDKRFKIGRAHV